MTDLSQLIERIEKSEGADEGALIEEAWEVLALASAAFRSFATAPVSGFGNNAGRFGSLMDARAYLDAAVMLVPDGWYWRAGHGVLWPGWAHLNLKHPDHCDRGDEHTAHAATPALALCAAALKARNPSK